MKLLKFSAVWCGPCKQQHRIFNEKPLSIELVDFDIEDDGNYVIERTNGNNNAEPIENIFNMFHIKNVPTMILVDDDFKELYRWMGVTQPQTIEEKINSLK
jgi:glutaredoxin